MGAFVSGPPGPGVPLSRALPARDSSVGRSQAERPRANRLSSRGDRDSTGPLSCVAGPGEQGPFSIVREVARFLWEHCGCPATGIPSEATHHLRHFKLRIARGEPTRGRRVDSTWCSWRASVVVCRWFSARRRLRSPLRPFRALGGGEARRAGYSHTLQLRRHPSLLPFSHTRISLFKHFTIRQLPTDDVAASFDIVRHRAATRRLLRFADATSHVAAVYDAYNTSTSDPTLSMTASISSPTSPEYSSTRQLRISRSKRSHGARRTGDTRSTHPAMSDTFDAIDVGGPEEQKRSRRQAGAGQRR
jgi:hypothetical protein